MSQPLTQEILVIKTVMRKNSINIIIWALSNVTASIQKTKKNFSHSRPAWNKSTNVDVFLFFLFLIRIWLVTRIIYNEWEEGNIENGKLLHYLKTWKNRIFNFHQPQKSRYEGRRVQESIFRKSLFSWHVSNIKCYSQIGYSSRYKKKFNCHGWKLKQYWEQFNAPII